MNLTNIKTILLLAPHPDDGEFGCGGTLKRLFDEGVVIWYAAFSPCNKSLKPGFDKGTLYQELPHAVAHLGINKENIITFQFPVREFPKFRQEILEEMIVLRKKIKPDLVILPNSLDIHQDHQVVNQEGIRAFKHTNILGYELPWNNFTFTNNAHVILERKHIQSKIEAIGEYKSQSFRNYMNEEFFFGLARTRGIQINRDYAEAFELTRWII
jgi:N-acetylglucosamine malate deacetylase 1